MDNFYKNELEIVEHIMSSYVEDIRAIDIKIHVLVDLFYIFHEDDIYMFEKQLKYLRRRINLLISEAKIIKDIVIDCKKQRFQ